MGLVTSRITAPIPVGAHEQCEAAMAAYQTHRYRGLALLVSSQKIVSI
jgi:hypothetical protein